MESFEDKGSLLLLTYSYLIVGIGLQSIKRCRSINKRWWLSQACHGPRLVSLKQHLLSYENIYEITWLKRITCLILSRTKRAYESQSYSWCIVFFFFSPRVMWKVWINLCILHHFDSETSHHSKSAYLWQGMSHSSKNVSIQISK